MIDFKLWILIGTVIVLLGTATLVVHILRRRDDLGVNVAIVEAFRLRVRAWWLLFTVLVTACLIGKIVTVILFGLISFWALREFITLTPTRPGDHRTLFWVFFLWTPLQYVVIGFAMYNLFGLEWLDFYSVMIPVYVFLFIPTRVAMDGDSRRFLERVAKMQAGILICVYCLSYAPALMSVPVHDKSLPFSSAGLLIFFVLMVQISDALQYTLSQVGRRHVIVPTIHKGRTWEGLIGGMISSALIGAALCWATPFTFWMSGVMSAVIALMCFAGSLTMSAIKRDRGVRDYGTLVEGHGGVLDRIDSLCFAAPVFFYLTRWWIALAT
ncbi:MAG: phosphatidate cytidylyltransferase [Planctomycetia bacterium]|jgi:phosphatidate cytidylyltransferase